MSISDEAVEAAFREVVERSSKSGDWTLEGTLRAALEAAAPHMMAKAATRAPKHQCEPWQMQVNASGTFRYCAACGEPTP